MASKLNLGKCHPSADEERKGESHVDGFSEPRLGMGAHHTHPLHSIPRNSATPGTRLPGENSLVHCSWGPEVWSQRETFLNIILQRNTRMGEDNLFRTIVFPWFTSCPFPLATQEIQDLNQQGFSPDSWFLWQQDSLETW